MYRVVVIGAGEIANSHLEAIGASGELQAVAVADIDADRARAAGRRFGVTPYVSYREMVEREQPDIAVVALPHHLHREAAVFAAEHGCHILLEKPMARNEAECDAIIRAAQQHGVTLMVGHTQHFKPENRRAKELTNTGALGRLVMVNDTRHLHYFREERPAWFLERAKAGGGILMNLGVHSVDKLQWLTDSRVVRVKASVSHFGPRGDVEGSGLAYLETDSGVAATISQSGYKGAAKDETELIFTGGMLKLVSGKGLWMSDGGEYRRVDVEEEVDPFALQFAELLQAIRSGSEPECSGAYGKSVVCVVEAMYRSHCLGAEVEVAQGGTAR